MSGGSHLTADVPKSAGDKTKIFRILAAACFFVLGILAVRSTGPMLGNFRVNLEEAFSWGFSFYWFCNALYALFSALAPAGYILVALGTLLGKRVFTVIGAVVCGLGYVFISLTYWRNMLTSLPMFFAWICLLLAACGRGKKCLGFGIAAAGFRLLNLMMILLIRGGRPVLLGILLPLLFIAGAILLAMDSAAKAAPPKKIPAAVPAAVSQTDRIGQLMQLKELLDAGILTQEEFEAKKAELLR